ncbi:hypothetical protein [Noviherbaspirillum suwonense]|uniref:AP2/ERF domain-containing protein n=1 Tax=Noviherbaspirillum suwonense TaxID=1224511 RepID=A0ABY1QJS9_9BURK|nr:hypothetical protein [Noviherbaspirillum suwonense]SMP72693.1 hypothetical protein SAMN06295970_11893 [Noviherbaspirillum suwonense]
MVKLYVNPNAGKGPSAVPKAWGFESSGQADTIFWGSLNRKWTVDQKAAGYGLDTARQKVREGYFYIGHFASREAAYKFAEAWTEGRSGKAYQHDPSNVEQSAIAEGLRTLGQKARAVTSPVPSAPPPPAPRQQKQDLKFFEKVTAQGSNAADPGFVLDF